MDERHCRERLISRLMVEWKRLAPSQDREDARPHHPRNAVGDRRRGDLVADGWAAVSTQQSTTGLPTKAWTGLGQETCMACRRLFLAARTCNPACRKKLSRRLSRRIFQEAPGGLPRPGHDPISRSPCKAASRASRAYSRPGPPWSNESVALIGQLQVAQQNWGRVSDPISRLRGSNCMPTKIGSPGASGNL